MEKFLKLLAQNKYLHKEEPLAVKDIILTQKKLVKRGYPFLPAEFLKFLQHYNGVSANDSAVLGIPPLADGRLDIVKYNREFNDDAASVILGHDDFGFLVYNQPLNCYQLVDKDSNMVLEEFADDELEYALISVLHVDAE
jgi:hypothetical protein